MVRAVFISFVLLALQGSSEPECALKRDEDGIKVFTCKSEGEKLKSLKAEFILHDVSLDELEKKLLDVKGYTSWQYNMIEADILMKSSDQEIIYRTVVHAPWPVEDRELVVKYTSTKDAARQTMDIVIQSVPYDYPKSKDLVRIPASYGIWHIEVQGKNLKVDYALRIDPGGSVPAWLVNIAMADGPHHSFRNLKKQIE